MAAAEILELEDGLTAGPSEIATVWLRAFNLVLESRNPQAVQQLLSPEVWWRDLCALTLDVTTAHGHNQVTQMLKQTLATRRMGEVALDETVEAVQGPDGTVRAFYTFTTDIGTGRGVVRLCRDGGEWKAWTVSTELWGLKDFPEPRVTIADAALPEHNEPVRPGTRLTFQDRRAREQAYGDRDPSVLVIGAGHCGLFLAARLMRLGVDTLVVDRYERAGDNWRLRYNNLALHDTKWWAEFPYMPYPETWPLFTPKEKLADWLEAYVNFLELNLWTSTHVESAVYDEGAGRWTVHLNFDGQDRVLRPNHLVFATGNSGKPFMPEFEGSELFDGVIVHSSAHVGGEAVTGKRVIVVGTASSGCDVAQDAYENGAEVNMVQRGPTYVLSQRNGVPMFHGENYSEASPPTEIADLLSASLPNGLKFNFAVDQTRRLAELDKDLLDGLDRTGFQTWLGPDDQGMLYMGLVKAGGYYIDKGASRLIIEGSIGLKRGEVVRFTPTGIVFDDGSEEPADVVVFCTGYSNMRDSARPILGDEVTDQLATVWGPDENGETRTAGRHSGHPKLWFFAGGFQIARISSRQLSVIIKAIDEGLIDPKISVEKKR